MPHIVFALWFLPGIATLAVLLVGVISGLHDDVGSIISWTGKSLLPLLGVLLSGYFLPSANPWLQDKVRRGMATAIMMLLGVGYYSIIAYHFVALFEYGKPIADTASHFITWLIAIQVVASAAFAPYFGLKQNR